MVMTYEGFLDQIEEYYGKYDSDRKKLVIYRYLQEYIKPHELQGLLRKILLKQSSAFRHTPDIATIEKIYWTESITRDEKSRLPSPDRKLVESDDEKYMPREEALAKIKELTDMLAEKMKNNA